MSFVTRECIYPGVQSYKLHVDRKFSFYIHLSTFQHEIEINLACTIQQ